MAQSRKAWYRHLRRIRIHREYMTALDDYIGVKNDRSPGIIGRLFDFFYNLFTDGLVKKADEANRELLHRLEDLEEELARAYARIDELNNCAAQARGVTKKHAVLRRNTRILPSKHITQPKQN